MIRLSARQVAVALLFILLNILVLIGLVWAIGFAIKQLLDPPIRSYVGMALAFALSYAYARWVWRPLWRKGGAAQWTWRRLAGYGGDMNKSNLMEANPEFILHEPASEKEIAALQSWFGHALPQQLVALLRISNGISFRNPYLPPAAPESARVEQWVLSSEGIQEDTAMSRTIWEDSRKDGRPDALGDTGLYLCFASTWNGDTCAYALDRQGETYRLVTIDHETLSVDDPGTQDLFELLPNLDPYEDGRD